MVGRCPSMILTRATDQGPTSCQVLGMSTLRGTPTGAPRRAYDSADHANTWAGQTPSEADCRLDLCLMVLIQACSSLDIHHGMQSMI